MLGQRCKRWPNSKPPLDQPQQTRHIDPMLEQCWADVVDGGPTLVQHWVDVLCLSGRLVFATSVSKVILMSRQRRSRWRDMNSALVVLVLQDRAYQTCRHVYAMLD